MSRAASGGESLQPGTLVQGIVKGQGLKAGEKVQRLRVFKAGKVRREPLRRMLDDAEYGAEEVAKEGFPHLPPEKFVDFFCRSHKGATPDTLVTRIETLWLPPVASDFRMEYIYAPDRFPQRQHCFVLTGREDSALHVSGYGDSKVQALCELKDTVSCDYRPLWDILHKVYVDSMEEMYDATTDSV